MIKKHTAARYRAEPDGVTTTARLRNALAGRPAARIVRGDSPQKTASQINGKRSNVAISCRLWYDTLAVRADRLNHPLRQIDGRWLP